MGYIELMGVVPKIFSWYSLCLLAPPRENNT